MSAELAVQEGQLPGLNENQIATLLSVLNIPDVSGLDLSGASPQEKVEIREAFRAQLAQADKIIAALKRPVTDLVTQCESDILKAIPAGATMLPHETFTVTRVQGTDRKRDVASLRTELPKTAIPKDEMDRIVFIKTVNTKMVDPEEVQKLLVFGAKAEWDVDLVKADAAKKKYGGEIADAIDTATAKVDKGSPYLVITPKESALKRVGQ